MSFRKISIAFIFWVLLFCLASVAQNQTEQRPVLLKTRIDKRSGLSLVRIPKGKYPGLAPLPQEPQGSGDPRQFINIPSLWFGVTDVTVAAYKKCVDALVCANAPALRDEAVSRCTWKNGLWSHPINCVTWQEAAQFCRWIKGRLPTATEWEYAAASGEPGKAYPWGESPPDGKHANFCDVNCPKALGTDGKNLTRWEKLGWIDRTQDDGWAATSPVGTYPAGATRWGLLDMAGNVWQWTSSEAGVGKHEVRGGSWDNAAASLMIGKRLAWTEGADAGMGFRCVKE